MQLRELANLLRSRAAKLLRKAILRGNLRPGRTLLEVSLEHQLQVTHAPILEAFRSLLKKGTLKSIPCKGTRVRLLNRTDIEETYSRTNSWSANILSPFIAGPQLPLRTDYSPSDLTERICGTEDSMRRDPTYAHCLKGNTATFTTVN